MLENFVTVPLQVDQHFHKWDQVLARPAPPEEQKFHTLVWHFARGMAFAAKGQLDKAKSEQAEVSKEAAAIPEDQPLGLNKAKPVASIAENVLTAGIARAGKDYAAAEASLKQAVAAQDKLNYDEPPDWFYPVREELGALYLKMEKPEDAERVFREDLAQNARNGRSLTGLVEALKRQKKDAEAELVSKQRDAAWKKADTKLVAEEL